MSNLQDKINTFFKKRNEIFKKPLEKMLQNMLDKCKYSNGESLERHNWGKSPIKLHFIPNIESPDFEKLLLLALDMPENEKSIVELLWGDIQLGKRVHACIIMWISVHILKRPVLYVFRNLTIDQKQLQDDILGTENYNFNIQFIKTLFQEFNNELQEYFQETNMDYWKDYKLPELKDINSNDIINKLNNKEAINSNDIFCCLMNHVQLEKINSKFSEYIYYNNELVNITVLVDESDLMTPTSSNDMKNKNDNKDTTLCEMLIAKIYKKVKYALHITGTAHSLLYNITTRLSDHTDIQIKISQVHKMKRTNDYFGLFKDGSITFDKESVEPWWEYQDENGKKTRYDIVEDYNINIKNIIVKILKRPPPIKYNSLLISEEKIKVNQLCLVHKIIKDFENLFVVIYHGNCLRLYLSKKYEKDIKYWSKWDSKHSSTSKRLCQLGGVYGSSIDTEKSERLPNNYCYFNIDTKILNIKFVYKLLRILFEENETPILRKTIITITGKYGERGYSFTSDDYDHYSLHLTDQYFVSHASLNCTDISQRLRLQGKYNDSDLKNKIMKLTLWTTPILHDIIQNFYVKFIKLIEKYIMSCESWEDIKDLLETKIIDNGELRFGKYMKYIDVSKKRKNLKPMKHYDSKMNGYSLISTDDMDDTEISNWCKETKLPDYICINEIQQMKTNEFLNKYGNPWEINTYFNLTINDLNKHFEKIGKPKHKPKLDTNGKHVCCLANEKLQVWDYDNLYNKLKNFGNDSTHGIHNGLQSNDKYASRAWVGYDQNGEVKYILKLAIKTNNKTLPKQTTDYIKKTPYFVNGDNVKYSVIKEEYKQLIGDDNKFPENYYWKTTDDWLYLYKKNKQEIISLDILEPSLNINSIQPNISTEPLINNDILLFVNSCCKKTDKSNLRIGITNIFKIYKNWCKINRKKCLNTRKRFKEEFEKFNYKEENGKGVDVNNNPITRGYNIIVSL